MIIKKQLKHLIACVFLLLSMLFSSSTKAQQWDGYTLFSIMGTSTARLVDTSGTVYHTWTFSNSQKTGYSSYLLPGGKLLRTVQYAGGNSFTGGPITGEVMIADWNGNILWDYVYSTPNYCTHHDVCAMPNGNVLLIAYVRKTAAEVLAAGCNTFSSEMWSERIVEVQPTGLNTGTVVWEWNLWDHLVQNVDPAKANYYPTIVDHPELLNINFLASKDWIHMNGIDYNPILDQITFSSRYMDEMYVIDHSTTTAEAASHTGGNSGKGGDLIYRWGRPSAYSAPGTQIINVVHDAHWIPEGVPNAGYLVGYNNNGTNNNQSYIDQVNTPVNGYNYNLTLGQAYTPASYTLRHTCNGYTSNMGNSHQLPNGNMLVNMATSGNFYELDPQGNTIWTFSWTSFGNGFNAQAFRYNTCYISNPAPPIPLITANGNTLTADSGVTWQWYLNGALLAGATGQSYTATQTGIYLVRITDSNSCQFSYSSGYNHQVIISTNEHSVSDELTIYPNPTSALITLDKNYFNGNDYDISVFDSYGKLIVQQKNSPVVNLTHCQVGIYNVMIQSGKTGTINKKIVLIR